MVAKKVLIFCVFLKKGLLKNFISNRLKIPVFTFQKEFI